MSTKGLYRYCYKSSLRCNRIQLKDKTSEMGVCASEELRQNKIRKTKKSHLAYEVKVKTHDEKQVRKIINGTFSRFDTNHDDFLDLQQLVELVRHSYHQETKGKQGQDDEGLLYSKATKLMRMMDQDSSGRVDRQEFYRFYKSQ